MYFLGISCRVFLLSYFHEAKICHVILFYPMKQALSFLFVLILVSAKAQKYDKIDSLREGLRKVTKSGKSGFINAQGELVIDLVYEAANGFFEGVSAVKKNGKVGYIDKNNRIVVPFDYDGGYNFNKGYAVVSTNKKYWMIDKTGKQVSLRKYDLMRFNGDFAMIVLDKKWGYVNSRAKEIIPPEYDMIHNYSEGMIGAKRGGVWGYIDTLDQVVLPFEFEGVSVFKDGVAVVEKDRKAGVIDKTGKTVISFNYQSLYLDDETGWYFAEKKDKTGMIDKRGREMISFDFDDIDGFSEVNEGFALMTIKDKTGMIDKKGNIVIPARYDKIFECENGYCGVEVNKKYGMVSLQNGREVISPKYDGLGNFEEGIARYKTNTPGIYVSTSKFGFVTVAGKELTSAKYENAEDFSNGMAAVKLNGKWGYINAEGVEVIFPRYEVAKNFANEKAIVYDDGNPFYVDKKGRLSEIPESEKEKLGVVDFAKEIEKLLKEFEADKEKTDGKYLVLSANKTPQTQQIIVSDTVFPNKQISKYWDQKYMITDLVIGGVGNDEYILVMEQGNYAPQSWVKRSTDEDVITSVREKYKDNAKNYISYLNYINNEWVVVYSQNASYTSQTVSAAGTAIFPEAWVNTKMKDGYSITSLAYGKNRWLVVMSKGSDYSNQRISITDNITESMIDDQKEEGYILSDLAKAGNKFYAIFSKVNSVSRYNHDKIILMGPAALKELTGTGRTILRSLFASAD